MGLKDHDTAVREATQRSLDTGTYLAPVQPTEPAAEWRKSDGTYLLFADYRLQRFQSLVDVLDPTLAPPISGADCIPTERIALHRVRGDS